LRRSSTVAAADDERKKDSPLPYGLGLMVALIASIVICGLWVHTGRLPHIYDERISDTREQRHCYHTPEYLTLATFLMGFHHRCGGETLKALKSHPHYDANVTHLICSFVDDSVPPRFDGESDGDTRIDVLNSGDDDCEAEDNSNSDSNDTDSSPTGHTAVPRTPETIELLPSNAHLSPLSSICHQHMTSLNRHYSSDSN
jgi:hypothetical protein